MSRLARRKWLVAGVAAGFAAFGGWFALRRYAPSDPAAEAVAMMFAQTLPDHAGQPLPLSSLRGRTVVLNFWATWCPPCIDEMPELAELHLEIEPRGGTVLGIGVDSAANIAEFARKSPYPYPLLVSGLEGIELARAFGNRIGALPFTVLIDSRGRVVDRTMGRVRIEPFRERVIALL